MGNPYKSSSAAGRAYDSALELTQDGRFSSDDFKEFRKSGGSLAMLLSGNSMADVLARAAYENNAQIDNDVRESTGIQQDRTSAGRLTTTFSQRGRGYPGVLDHYLRGGSSSADNRAAITGIGRARNQYTPNGTRRGRPLYTRTYTHVLPTERWEENPSAGNRSGNDSQIDNRPGRAPRSEASLPGFNVSDPSAKPGDDIRGGHVTPGGGGQHWLGGTPHFDESTGRYTDEGLRLRREQPGGGGQQWIGGTPHFDENTGRYTDGRKQPGRYTDGVGPGEAGIGDFMRDQFDPSKKKDPDGKPETNSGSLLKKFIGKVPQLGDISKLYKSYASNIK